MDLLQPIAFTGLIVYPLLGITPACQSRFTAGVMPQSLQATSFCVKLAATFTPVSEDGE